VNIALIGIGMVAETHINAIKRSSHGLRLCGVLGRDAAKTAQFAAIHQTHAFPSIDAIALDPSVDVVIIATPPDARLEAAKKLASAGKPILLEKPIERTLNAAREIVEICEKARVPLGVVFQHRVRAASIALKETLASNRLGTIVSAEIRVPWWRDQAYYDVQGRGTYARDGGGVMISQAIHTLDLAHWLLGPIIAVQAMMRRTALHHLEAEDWTGALLEFDCGAVGTLMATTAAFPGGAETIALQGTKGAALLGEGILTLTDLNGETEVFGASATTGGGSDPMGFTHAWHQSVIEDFADAIAQGRPPLIPAREALLTHAVIDAMERASKSGQRTVVN
jgi:UDP-N-acetyl-2-amino-2-deoxyglucuronate dehydrogenase